MNFFKKKLFLFCCLLLAITTCFLVYKALSNSIQKISSFNQIDFDKIKADSLIIFDADETLIQPTDSYYINEFTPQAIGFKKDFIAQHSEITDWDLYADVTIKEVQRPLIEPMIIDKIRQLQQRKVSVIVCTGINTGKYGNIPRLEQWRYEHLKSLGFQGSFQDQIIEFPAQGNRHPVFYKGILATDQVWKGKIIGLFLDHFKLQPHRIIMFDDMKQELESVQDECKKRNVAFQGYEYKGAKSKPWDEALIKFQTEYLIEHKKWLSDQEAYALISGKK